MLDTKGTGGQFSDGDRPFFRRHSMNFAHLHVHTEYSLLDGSNKIKEYVGRVKELGMNSAAITDHGVMYGVIDFYRAAKAAGHQTDPRMRGLCGAQLPV